MSDFEDRFWSKVAKAAPDECWVWTAGTRPFGHGAIKKRGRTLSAHRVSYEMHTGKPIPEGMSVLHSCDNPPCVNPAHLRVGTAADNSRDCVERGRHRRPANSGKRRRLTPEDVRVIRAGGRAHGVLSEHARRLGVSIPTVWKVLDGRSYRDVH